VRAWGSAKPGGGGAEAGQAVWGRAGDGDGDDGYYGKAQTWHGEQRRRRWIENLFEVRIVLYGVQVEKV
jgi:hypothetical protein